MVPLAVLLLVRIVFSYSGLFFIPFEAKNLKLSRSVKSCVGILIEITMNLYSF